MEYTAVNSFFQNLVSLALENRLVLGLLWIVAMYFFLKKLSKKDNERKQEAAKVAEQINNKEYSVQKLSTENNELYGSVKPTEISKLIQEENKVEIKPSMIQPVEEIKSLGKFKVKISLHSEVDAEIVVNVTSADTIQ